jgi:predicted ribosomally synthesized peptide with SipW-like signal peptide
MSRTPLVVAVVGALLIGGATTGTTLALWHDQETLSGSVSSGTMAFTVNGSTTVTFDAINNLAMNSGDQAGAAQSFTADLTAGGAGKNLRMRMFVDDVTTGSSELNDGLEVALTGAPTAGDCPAATAATYTPLSGTNSVEVTNSSVAGVPPGTSRALCVAVRVRPNAPAATAGKSGQLTITFRGQQVRP